MKSSVLRFAALALPALVAGCSGGPSLPSLSTGSVTPATTAAAPVQPEQRNDPTSRAFQVSTTSARAVKCGFNFDPARLRAQYMASETTVGTPVTELGKVEKVYDIGYNGISRGIAEKQDYCTEAKTKEIKADLTRHLAGDYSPRPVKQVAAAKEESSFWGGLFDADEDVESGPKIGTPEWWEKQKEKAGK